MAMKNNFGAGFLYAMLTLLCVADVKAQTGISGTVTDTQQQPVSHASVHLLNTQTYAITNTAGVFAIEGLQPGRYTIELSAIGYATLAKDIELNARNHPSFSFQLSSTLAQLETVVVTADKKETLLQQTPVSVTALSARQVTEYRLWNIKELSAIVPNFYSGNPGDERNVSAIRGIATTSYDPSVATYIDGVNQFSLDTYIPQLSDIERIEVLRGPQGTLYGRNAMGGVINIITKKPANSPGGFFDLSFGNYGQQRFAFGFRMPIVKDKLFMGFSGVKSKRDGYYKNEFTNTSFDSQDQESGNVYLKYLPTAAWSLTLNTKFQGNTNNGAFPVVNGVDDALKNPYVLNQNAVGKMFDNTLNASLSVAHKGRLADFTWQTAWQNNYRYYGSPIDGDFSPLDAVTIMNDYGHRWNNVKVFTNEIRLGSAANKTDKLSWTTGAYFFQQRSPNKQATHFGKDAGLLGVPGTDFATINTTTGKNTGAALYGQISYLLSQKLTITGGLRFDYENKKLDALGEYQPDGQGAVVTRSDTAASVHFSAFSPKLSLKYQLTETSNLYVGYSRGFRTGGLTQLSGDPSQPPLYPYQPEYSNNIELGTKNTFFNNRFRINAVVFLTFLNNAQVPVLVLPDAITITKNSGKLLSMGAELELSANLLKGLQADYSFGYTNARYKSSGISSNGQVIDLDGKKQVYTPDITSMLALQYSYSIREKKQLQLLVRAEWQYLGKRYFDFANTIQQNGNGIVNVKAGVHYRYLELYGWMRNATGKKYIEFAYDFGAVHLASPRTIGVTLATRF